MDNIITSVKSMFNKNDEDFTAERAWIETTYGTGSYRPIEKRIAEKQSYIKSVIKGFTKSGLSFVKICFLVCVDHRLKYLL